jgi:hypothetical protein
MELQELIARGRFMFSRAPGRLRVFSLVNGRRSAKGIAAESKRRLTNTLRDLQALREVGLIEPRRDSEGNGLRKDGSLVYEKSSLARHIPLTYFHGPVRIAASAPVRSSRKTRTPPKATPLPIPTEQEVLDICSRGEDQTYEFKGPGAEPSKLAKEVAAFLHNRSGGMILYGIDDSGRIVGTDVVRQRLDQPLQNAVRNSISPAAHFQLRSLKVMGTEILVISVPPWNRKEVYFYEGRAYVRKGTNAFQARPEEIRRLDHGEYVA